MCGVFHFFYDHTCAFWVESSSFWRVIFLVIGGKENFLLLAVSHLCLLHN
jgi:hypothetical protein